MAKFILLLFHLIVFTSRIFGSCVVEQYEMACFGSTESEFLNATVQLNVTLQKLEFINTKIPKFTKRMFENYHLKSISYLIVFNTDLNEIEDGMFEGYEYLLNVDIKLNHLKRINFGTFQGIGDRIEYMNIEESELEYIEPGAFIHTPKLIALNLNDNNIKLLEAGTFYGISSSYIHLQNNRIERIEAGAFYGIGGFQLYLGNNNLTKLENGAFEGLSQLIYLYLDNNPFSTLNYAAFKGLYKMQYLYLRNTGIKEYDMDQLIYYMPYLRTVYI